MSVLYGDSMSVLYGYSISVLYGDYMSVLYGDSMSFHSGLKIDPNGLRIASAKASVLLPALCFNHITAAPPLIYLSVVCLLSV